MRRKKPAARSIAGRVQISTRSIVVLLILPVLLSLTMMIFYAMRYRAILSKTETAASLRPVVSEEISERLFSVSAGRTTYEDSGVDVLIQEINDVLDDLQMEMDEDGQLQLTLASRTMRTLESYAIQVRDGLQEGRAISEIETIVDEVRDVSSLLSNMLTDFIVVEINAAARVSRTLVRLIIATALLEALLVFYALFRTRAETRALAHSIRTSILELENIVSQFTGGDLTARVPAVDLEELQELADQINIMADRLETTIAQIKTDQEDIAKYELRLLQAQINPHFLYNTLDTIIWEAEAGNSDEVIHLTRSLSDFFRIALSSGAEWITLSQEFQHIESYLSIQKTRYRDILNYSLSLPEELARIPMVKLLLQPLVENALYHGIKAKRGGGVITVSAVREEENIRFSVSDTGKGMPPEKVQALLDSFHTPSGITFSTDPVSHGFGIRNVDMRIRLYYQQKEGLQIASSPEGTVVSFSVPVNPPAALLQQESHKAG